MPPVALTVAASDPLGGAGLQADLTTFAALGVHPVCAVTAVTAQSLTEVQSVWPVDPNMVRAQILGVAGDEGFTLGAAKTGLLASHDVVDMVASLVADGVVPAPVVDPVMVDRRGARFTSRQVEAAYRRRLMPVAAVITPNRAEAELLCGAELRDADAVLANAEALRDLGAPAVVVTGGAFDGPPHDVVITGNDSWVAPGRRVRTRNVRGSGCTFSAALTAGLALGIAFDEAVRDACRFVAQAIATSARWQAPGPGPVAHTVGGRADGPDDAPRRRSRR